MHVFESFIRQTIYGLLHVFMSSCVPWIDGDMEAKLAEYRAKKAKEKNDTDSPNRILQRAFYKSSEINEVNSYYKLVFTCFCLIATLRKKVTKEITPRNSNYYSIE